MKNFKYISTLFFVLVAVIVSASIVRASGNLTTSQDNQAGQTRLVNRNGVLYLTTDVNAAGDQTTTTSDSTSTSGDATRSGREIDLYPPRYARSASQVIRAVLNLVLLLAVLLVFFFIISAAFEWITSGGDKGKTDKARQKIIAAIVGIIIVVSSYALLRVVARFLGFDQGNGVELRIPTIQQFNQTATPSATPVLTSPTPTPVTQ